MCLDTQSKQCVHFPSLQRKLQDPADGGGLLQDPRSAAVGAVNAVEQPHAPARVADVAVVPCLCH